MSDRGDARLLRDACTWALSRIEPEGRAVERAAVSLACCLAGLEQTSWPDAVAYFSRLNADGCPVEFAFSSRDAQLRYTCEAGPPEAPAAFRLVQAGRLMRSLGQDSLPTEVERELIRLQGASPCHWGAALGGRHSASCDRYKIYAEVPASSGPCGLDRGLARLEVDPRWRRVMIGWELGSDRVEHYYRTDSPTAPDLRALLTRLRLDERWRELAHVVEAAAQGSIDAALEGSWGMSLAGPRSGACDAFSLFKVANKILGGDARVRARLLALVRSQGTGNLEAYARVSRALGRFEGAGAHGMLAFSLAQGRPLELRIGLSPVAAFLADQGRLGRAPLAWAA
jgi:hypothetical protein